MRFFESLLALLLAAILCLQVARRLHLPYPALLAVAGMGVALIPGTPTIALDPQIALSLFIAPVLVDAAFDFPLGAALRFWAPLVALAVFAVIVTAGLVAWAGWMLAGLPIAAAVALGAVVAPPDAAAATAVLGSVSIPRSTDAVLKGESLFNDATALLLFGAAVEVQMAGGLHLPVALRLGLAAPGGVLLGMAAAFLARVANRFVAETLGGTLLQFVWAFILWIVAERLRLSPVLAMVSFAMTLASGDHMASSPRMRVHSFAVWSTVVFLLNVLAFLLMGMQAKLIVGSMAPGRFADAARFAGVVVGIVIASRIAVILGYNRLMAWAARARGEKPPATVAQALLVGWAGMRGLVTLATAFALPQSFPQRDLVALTAFAVVLATLVIQGVTLAPLIRLLRLDQGEKRDREMLDARAALAEAALLSLDEGEGRENDHLRYLFGLHHAAAADGAAGPVERLRELGLAAVRAQRDTLEALRDRHRIGGEAYLLLQEELDWKELTLLPEDDRRIEEG
jgi:CPA1 family monovalent cation:H+ antiporter